MDYTGRIVTKNQVVPTASSAPGIWTLDEAMQYTKQGKWPPGYQIGRSVRLRSSAGGYFNRTPTTTSNRTTWTWSGWIKRGAFAGDVQYVFALLQPAVINEGCRITASNTLDFYLGGVSVAQLITTQVFRDPSAWYHLVVAVDTTQVTSSNRIKIYINGSQVTAFTTANYPTQTYATGWNTTYPQYIGYQQSGWYLDCYMTEINFIDGQQLTPASFGYFDTATGVWQPAPYNGTYGTNGFYLNFSDNSAATATTIGKDYSGNGNNWTPNNISVTAGSTYDSMVDVPINYGNDTGVGGSVRGNYATINPVDVSIGATSAFTITKANLSVFSSSLTRVDSGYSTFSVTSGKWYVEVTRTTVATVNYPSAGWCSTSFDTNGSGLQHQAGGADNPKGASTDAYGRLWCNGTAVGSAGGYWGINWYSVNDVIQIAVDIDNKLIWFGKANAWSGTAGNTNGNPATGTNGTSFSAQGGTEWKFQCGVGDSNGADVNFGQRAFSYTAPSGFKALCTQNLSVPTILNGANYNAATLYTGNGGTLAVSNGANNTSGTTFQPDMVWIKSRSANTDHKLTDSVRGATIAVISNSTAAETTDSTGLTAFGSSGFTVGANTTYNNSGATYVGWGWKGGGTAVTNTSGTITSSVSANTTAGFSVVIYTSTTGTVGHGLGVTPSMIMAKVRNNTDQWIVYHIDVGNTIALPLNSTGGGDVNSGFWNNTSPTSTVFSQGSWNSSYTKVAYCFAPISGYSAFGSYTGNGSTDGPFVYCGFRPRFVLMKRSGTTGSWYIWDTSRSPYNQMTLALYPNLNEAEPGGDDIDFLSNGFKIRDTFSYINASGGTYIWAAFAENPFTIARAR